MGTDPERTEFPRQIQPGGIATPSTTPPSPTAAAPTANSPTTSAATNGAPASGPQTRLRVGLGHDTHRLADGGPLVLGGVLIPYDRHLVGHSDADALLHAITDALLGAAALGDIGEMFSDVDPVNRGRDSADMLRRAHDKVRAAGWRIVNLDCIVFAQRPKLSPYKAAMQARIAEILEISPEQVGVKAKTGELVGPVGREEALMTECVTLVERIF